MAKFYGEVGYIITTETSPGIFSEDLVKKYYYGDEIKHTVRVQSSDKINDDLIPSSQVSIIADPYANNNYLNIRYVMLHGVRWKITNVDIQRPRIILTLGGVYNG